MRRNLENMATKTYDILVIGGGITGASVAWDASLRGLSVGLVEKDDFAHATTSGSSKMVHGGLRYLINGELKLVRESLRERRIWENIAPHMVHPLPFVIPTYGWGMKSGLVLSIGLAFYDLLSFDRNFLSDEDKKLPAYRSISRGGALQLMPHFEKEGLTGAKIYYDCQMFSPERLCLECIEGAVEYGADAANYAEATGFIMSGRMGEGARVEGVHVRDKLTGQMHELKAKLVINAGGPWADRVMGLAEDGEPSRHLIRSKGIHLITRALTKDHALTIQSVTGGHFFVIPWRGHTLIGTTDVVFKGDPDQLGVSEQDIMDFLRVVNDSLPGLNLARSDVQHFYAGIRPLVDNSTSEGGAKDSYNASRSAEIVDHAKIDALEGFLSAMGGKWTTSRHLAEQIVDLALRKLNRRIKCETHCTPTYGGEIGRMKSFVTRAAKRHPELPQDCVENLCRFYGSRIDQVLATADERPDERKKLLQRLSPDRPDLAVQIAYAVRHEMALHLPDVLSRRTGLGTLGDPGEALISNVANLMANELGWSTAETADEMAQARRLFTTLPNASQEAYK